MHGTLGTGVALRSTIEDIVGHRNRALELYATAFDAIAAADRRIKEAADVAGRCHPGTNSYNYAHNDETKAFYRALQLPDRAQYLRTARKIIDINAWAWLIERTDMERLMDREAKDKLREQMAYVPDRIDPHSRQLITGEEIEKGLPELTVDNVYATIEQFLASADTIFRRGIANAFSKLDRRFRSHDGFKIGSRVILTYMFSDYGGLNYGGVRDTLIDIERVFAVLDGIPEASFTSALRALEEDRRHRNGRDQSETETPYFKIRGYKNGNAHLWFTRDDLVEKVNKLLAEHYGEVIGDGQTKDEDPLEQVKNAPAKYWGFYPTPDEAARTLIDKAWLYRRKDQPRMRILEPSAGTGNIARLCFQDKAERRRNVSRDDEFRWDPIVDCVEIQPHLVEALRQSRDFNRVLQQDFLTLDPASTGLYDRVLMNPPFDRERDIDHVVHALKFLKPDGYLVAIVLAGTEFRETKKATAFRALMTKLHASWRDLPAGSFSSVGTNVNTILLRVWADGRGNHGY